MKSEFELIGIGASPLDQLWVVSEFASGEGVQMASSMMQQGGGPVATALCTASRLGVPCLFLDLMGDDLAGNLIREDLERHGVQIQQDFILKGKTSHQAVILVRETDGARHIVHRPGTVGELEMHHIPEKLPGRVLHLNGRHEKASLLAAQRAKAQGMIVSFDGGANRWKPSLQPILNLVDWLVVAWDFAQQMLEARGSADWDACTLEVQAQRLIENLKIQCPSAQVIAITRGALGSWWIEDGEASSHPITHQPARQVKVVDTTGAGDTFHGAFLAAMMRGKGVRFAMDFASWVAACTCESLGGRSALRQFTLETLDQYQNPDNVFVSQ